jgi:phage I-like protein
MREAFEKEGGSLLVDFDHFSLDSGKSTEAAGWITNVEVRENGLWAKIEWTDIGEPAVLNKRYRFVSPVFRSDEVDPINERGFRPFRLDCLALTNQPNMKKMQPLSNRGGGDGLPISHRNKETDSMKKVLELLGLSADAAEDPAVEAVTALKNRAAEAEALKNRAEAAEQKVADLAQAALEADADAFCDKYADHITNRETVREQFVGNRETTEKLFGGIKVAERPAGKTPDSLRNRKGADAGTVLGNRKEEQQAKVSEVRNRLNCSHTEAFEQAARENPALFSEAAGE